jgi:hypothetical protein
MKEVKVASRIVFFMHRSETDKNEQFEKCLKKCAKAK